MLEIIASYPELRGVFASNPMVAKGAPDAGRAQDEQTGDKINLVGFDSDDQLVKFLKDGTIAALIMQDPFYAGPVMQDPFYAGPVPYGLRGVKIALAASKGDQVPANVDTGATVITKANMNSARSQELLNPQVIGIGGQP